MRTLHVMELVTIAVLLVAAVAVVWAIRRGNSPHSVEPTVDGAALAQLIGAEVKAQLGDAATSALQANNEQFLALATERMNAVQAQTKGLLDPFSKQMEQLGRTVGDLRSAHEQDKGAVQKMTGEMGRQITELTSSTLTLSEALRSPTARGAWGENQLRNVVELSGMSRYCDYDEQFTGENREGSRGRPDVRVRLPNGAHIAVDSKVPLDAYLDAQAATETTEVEAHMARHAAALRSHVKQLSGKKYWEQGDGPSPEFVVLFVPGESFLADALRSDHTLLNEAMEKRVLLASPVNLLALLWAVSRGWQEARVSEHAREIADLGQELYDRVGVVLGHVDKTGRGLATAVGAFNDLVGSVDGRLLVTMRKFPDLGAGSTELTAASEVDALPRHIQATELTEVPLEERDQI
ncbi:MAG: DNA recombination protein RmuC [Acidimicrobiaceae bacterium]|nr:DNA recombination protein RmuC [Acidimicrobiaceae bacterium]